MSSVAHEFGHCLGIADAYTKGDIIRSYQTDETGWFDEDGLYQNIMFNSGAVGARIMDNDIEMALQAQAESLSDIQGSSQAYIDHETVIGGKTFGRKQSSVIRKK